MIRILLTLLILLLACPSWAATVYIDPDCSHNGDGTEAACASSSGGRWFLCLGNR